MGPLALAWARFRGVRCGRRCSFKPWQRPCHGFRSEEKQSSGGNGRMVKDKVNRLSVRELEVLVFKPLVGLSLGSSRHSFREVLLRLSP